MPEFSEHVVDASKAQSVQIAYYIDFKYFFQMELFGSLAYSFITRNETNYSQLNDNINKLIDDLGDKIQHDLVSIEENMLLGFKENLFSAQQEYKQLQKNRNDEVIKEKVLTLKSEQQKLFNQEELKSMEMNKLYDKIKIDLKKNVEYEHQLQLEIKFLTKQLTMARKKAELLDQEIEEMQHQDPKRESISSVTRNCHFPTIKKTNLLRKSYETEKEDTLAERRTRNKIESMKEYIQLLSKQQTEVQRLLGKYDISACKSLIQKEQLAQNIFKDREFKKYLYKVLYRNKKIETKVQ